MNPAVVSASDLDTALARLGYTAFRPGQREAVETLLAQGRLLLVAPTGGGKSLSYQLPATLLPGTTLVISPLVALMADQVQALEARGVSATYLAATLDAAEIKRRMARLASGAFRLVYVAPERLAFPGFRAMLHEVSIPLIAVDEAHCISEWGHDFRPEYLGIGALIADFPSARVLACTATATPIVRDEILARLGLPAGHAPDGARLRPPEPRPPRGRGGGPARARAAGGRGARRGPRRARAPRRHRDRLRADTQEGRGGDGPPGRPRLGGRGLSRRARRPHARARPARVRGGAGRGRGGDQRLRDGHRPVRRPRGDPPGPPGSIEAYYQEVGRAGRDGVARPRTVAGQRRRSPAAPGPARAGRRTARHRTPRWSSTSGECSSS